MPPAFPGELFNRFGPGNIEFVKSKNGDGVRIAAPSGQDPLAFTQATLMFFETILR